MTEKNIVGVNKRHYPTEVPPQVPVKVVLVLGIDGKVRGYAGCGSDLWVADYGNKVSYAEAKIHFPNLSEKDYQFH